MPCDKLFKQPIDCLVRCLPDCVKTSLLLRASLLRFLLSAARANRVKSFWFNNKSNISIVSDNGFNTYLLTIGWYLLGLADDDAQPDESSPVVAVSSLTSPRHPPASVATTSPLTSGQDGLRSYPLSSNPVQARSPPSGWTELSPSLKCSIYTWSGVRTEQWKLIGGPDQLSQFSSFSPRFSVPIHVCYLWPHVRNRTNAHNCRQRTHGRGVIVTWFSSSIHFKP